MKERLASWAAEVPERMAGWRRDVDARLTSDEQPVNMARLLHELNRTLPADAILVADGGFAAHWGGLLFDTKQPGRGCVPDRGFASRRHGAAGGIGSAPRATQRGDRKSLEWGN